MALIKRLVKGSPLTFQEGDNNLQYLEDLSNNVSASFNSWTGSSTSQFAGTSSYATYAANANIDTSIFATTGSNTFNGNQTISGSLIFSEAPTKIYWSGSLPLINVYRSTTATLPNTYILSRNISWDSGSTLSTAHYGILAIGYSTLQNLNSNSGSIRGNTAVGQWASNVLISGQYNTY